MGRLPLGPMHSDDEVVAEVFDGFADEGREPIALYRALSHAPSLLRAFSGVGRGLRHDALTPRPLRELVVLRVAQLTGSAYEWSHHKGMALAAGVTQRQLDELAGWPGSDAFDRRERAALRCAEEVHELAVTDATYAELEALFTAHEIVEIVLTAAHYQSVARVIQALGVDVEPAYAPFLDRDRADG